MAASRSPSYYFVKLLVLPVLLLAGSATSQGPPPGFPSLPGLLPGTCSQQLPVMDFDVEKYVGKWYEVERTPNAFEFGRCGRVDYKLEPDGSVRVNNTEILENGVSNTAIGRAEFAGTFNEGRLRVAFENTPGPPPPEDGNYFVLATDYDNYAVVWSCTSVPANVPSKIEYLWILGRRQVLDPHFLLELKHWLVHRGVDVSRLIMGLQINCPP